MEIVRVEPTPSPNTMKIVLNEKRKDNKSNTYTTILDNQPKFINDVLAVDGVKSIFYVMDFLAVDKKPKYDWEVLLPKVTATLSDESESIDTPAPDEHFGEVKAEVLQFKGIPYQVKLTSSSEEKRKQLPEVYIDSMLAAQKDDDNIVFQRKWENLGIRYGELDDIMSEVTEEILALYPEKDLNHLVENALNTDVVIPEKKYQHVTLETYQATDDWKERLRMLKAFPTPTERDFPLLGDAVSEEEKTPLRREAIVLLGMIEDKAVLPYLFKGLHDKSPAVRRTAGDCLSDLGFKQALPEMEKALDDPHKIVRWRAAMFIFDEGGPEQLDALRTHENDPAYEVKLQIEMAIARIENGDEALGSVWKQIANRNKS
ncbi:MULTISPECIES: conserved virulence factor C family protein [Staphylococcus]|uniref:Conserved virulence factor C n=1 Tax=Staphylococcus saprophyticus subsp. saprophyticus (strain ATCC 15305 / DSM 20229 / NCIMB 8711 / NCTC 7292 / S-41) TaxID=342451 RepID=CVFC_STAS1|nr:MULTISPECIES: conserved virulence factor C family protein [Staphylococcus]Q49XP0.1 RecName: Full=Conserved virulence factor C [Staphylococcus saprophyticus subsp. saprophyticus ATCC 15305 = NCTC 7292]CRV19167.1 Conserved virulence factor C [Streptococcus equi subsp. equi]ASE59386.1 virulence factor C [Staphylococcus saprophyticus]ASF18155.1 virulence factor C [Staphylococcus saprophyticus]MBN6755579.1 virulence factor C [Staphylococcus saprophyticus]MBN6765557.1 virulence factor C [Staphyl